MQQDPNIARGVQWAVARIPDWRTAIYAEGAGTGHKDRLEFGRALGSKSRRLTRNSILSVPFEGIFSLI